MSYGTPTGAGTEVASTYQPTPSASTVSGAAQPQTTITFGKYITHKTPTARSGDSLLGQVMGYMSEMMFWIDQEGLCGFVDAVIPDQWWCQWVQDFLFLIIKGHYNGNYQKQYNAGADQGNKLSNTVLGWVDDAKAKFNQALSDARTQIETQLINPIKAKIANEIEPRIKDVLARIGTAETTINDAQNRVNEALTDVAHLKDTVNLLTLQARILRDKVDATIRDFNAKITALNDRLTSATTDVDAHTKNIKELFDRVNAVEKKVSEQKDSFEWLRSYVK